jgi:hypothetical protein
MARGGGLAANFLTCSFYQGHCFFSVYPAALRHNISKEARFTLQDLLPCFVLYQGHYSHKSL